VSVVGSVIVVFAAIVKLREYGVVANGIVCRVGVLSVNDSAPVVTVAVENSNTPAVAVVSTGPATILTGARDAVPVARTSAPVIVPPVRARPPSPESEADMVPLDAVIVVLSTLTTPRVEDEPVATLIVPDETDMLVPISTSPSAEVVAVGSAVNPNVPAAVMTTYGVDEEYVSPATEVSAEDAAWKALVAWYAAVPREFDPDWRVRVDPAELPTSVTAPVLTVRAVDSDKAAADQVGWPVPDVPESRARPAEAAAADMAKAVVEEP